MILVHIIFCIPLNDLFCYLFFQNSIFFILDWLWRFWFNSAIHLKDSTPHPNTFAFWYQCLLYFLIFYNVRYYEGLQRCMGLYSANGQYSSDEVDRLEALYVSLSKQYSRSSAVKVKRAFSLPLVFSLAIWHLRPTHAMCILILHEFNNSLILLSFSFF